MVLWRLCRRSHADLGGEGARIFGGRWNGPGRQLVYLAEHPALATLEVRVHLDLPFELLPADYVLMRISVPDHPNIVYAVNDGTVAVGDTWLTEARSLTLRVPSILIPHACNVLLNPHHPNVTGASVDTVEPVVFDPRLWHPLAGEG